MHPIKKTYFIIGILWFTLITGLSAQVKHNELSFCISGGLSTLRYSVTEGDFTAQGGGSIGFGYLLKINDLWGIGTGAELSLYQSKTKFPQYSDSYSALSNSIPGGNIEQNSFNFKFTYTNLQEKQKALYLNVPVFFQIQSPKASGIYAKTGIKIGIPINAVYNSQYATLQTSAYFPYENIEYTDLPNHGFNSYPANQKKSDLKVKYSISPFIEVGWKWSIKTSYNIYTGIYAEHGIKPIYTISEKKPFLQYHNDGTISENPLWESRHEETNAKNILSSSVYPMSIGVIIRWSFAL